LITLHAVLLNTKMVSTSLTPSTKQKCSCIQERIKFACQSIKQLKFEIYLLNLPRTSSSRHHGRSLVDVLPEHPLGPRACNFSSAAHVNHAGVQQLTKGPRICGDARAVALAITVDILPLPLASWMDHHPVLPTHSLGCVLVLIK
jgi:hypothetical protein